MMANQKSSAPQKNLEKKMKEIFGYWYLRPEDEPQDKDLCNGKRSTACIEREKIVEQNKGLPGFEQCPHLYQCKEADQRRQVESAIN